MCIYICIHIYLYIFTHIFVYWRFGGGFGDFVYIFYLLNFYLFLRSGEEQTPVGDEVKYFKENNIQLGANREIFMMLMYLIEVHEQKNMPGAAEYFKNIFNELAGLTKYVNHL